MNTLDEMEEEKGQDDDDEDDEDDDDPAEQEVRLQLPEEQLLFWLFLPWLDIMLLEDAKNSITCFEVQS